MYKKNCRLLRVRAFVSSRRSHVRDFAGDVRLYKWLLNNETVEPTIRRGEVGIFINDVCRCTEQCRLGRSTFGSSLASVEIMSDEKNRTEYYQSKTSN